MTTASEVVRELNDRFRTASPTPGWLATSGVLERGPAFVARAVRQVQAFDAFDEGNDPYAEHDFGAFDLEGQRLFWKIDCYDLDYRFGSEDPANPSITRRVLTILLASEY